MESSIEEVTACEGKQEKESVPHESGDSSQQQ
jgi:hypothetical protein